MYGSEQPCDKYRTFPPARSSLVLLCSQSCASDLPSDYLFKICILHKSMKLHWYAYKCSFLPILLSLYSKHMYTLKKKSLTASLLVERGIIRNLGTE